jgi:pimeloyl-ACP methyl ester carboxylesterase
MDPDADRARLLPPPQPAADRPRPDPRRMAVKDAAGALIFAGRHLLKDWTVMDRLGEITAPTLIVAGQDDFIFPPEHQRELAAAIPRACLQLIERAGHNPHAEQPAEVMRAIRDFISS